MCRIQNENMIYNTKLANSRSNFFLRGTNISWKNCWQWHIYFKLHNQVRNCHNNEENLMYKEYELNCINITFLFNETISYTNFSGTFWFQYNINNLGLLFRGGFRLTITYCFQWLKQLFQACFFCKKYLRCLELMIISQRTRYHKDEFTFRLNV